MFEEILRQALTILERIERGINYPDAASGKSKIKELREANIPFHKAIFEGYSASIRARHILHIILCIDKNHPHAKELLEKLNQFEFEAKETKEVNKCAFLPRSSSRTSTQEPKILDEIASLLKAAQYEKAFDSAKLFDKQLETFSLSSRFVLRLLLGYCYCFKAFLSGEEATATDFLRQAEYCFISSKLLCVEFNVQPAHIQELCFTQINDAFHCLMDVKFKLDLPLGKRKPLQFFIPDFLRASRDHILTETVPVKAEKSPTVTLAPHHETKAEIKVSASSAVASTSIEQKQKEVLSLDKRTEQGRDLFQNRNYEEALLCFESISREAKSIKDVSFLYGLHLDIATCYCYKVAIARFQSDIEKYVLEANKYYSVAEKYYQLDDSHLNGKEKKGTIEGSNV